MRKATNSLPTFLNATSYVRPRKSVDPFKRLLRERARDERMMDICRNLNNDSDVEADTERDDLGEGPSGSCKSLQQQNGDEGDIENAMAEADRRRLLDEEDNTVLERIIESDRHEKGKGKAVEEVWGIQFWQVPAEEAMEVEYPFNGLPNFVYDGRDPYLILLRDFVQANGRYIFFITN